LEEIYEGKKRGRKIPKVEGGYPPHQIFKKRIEFFFTTFLLGSKGRHF
jgi:hypothetical protein